MRLKEEKSVWPAKGSLNMTTEARRRGTVRDLTREGLRIRRSSQPYGKIGRHATVATESITARVRKNRSDVTNLEKLDTK